MGVAPSRVKEGTGEGQTTDGWQLEGTVEADFSLVCIKIHRLHYFDQAHVVPPLISVF